MIYYHGLWRSAGSELFFTFDTELLLSSTTLLLIYIIVDYRSWQGLRLCALEAVFNKNWVFEDGTENFANTSFSFDDGITH